MPSVMIRRNPDGKLSFYIAKKDQEETVESLEFDSPDRWGGTVVLEDGSSFYIDPLPQPPKLPTTLRAKRAGED